MIAASIRLDGLDAVHNAMTISPEITFEELTTFATGAAVFMESEIKERTEVATGTLRNSWLAERAQREGDGVSSSVGTALAYAVPVELGSAPHFPPIAAIADWVKVKLGIGGPAGEKIAYAIARKIASKGTKAQHMVARAFEAGRAEIERQFAITVQNIKRRIAGAARGA